MGDNASDAEAREGICTSESWLVQGLHDGRIWADSAEQSDVREFAINEDRTLPSMACWLAVEYGRRFPDFNRVAYNRAWEAAIGLVWLRRRAAEEKSAPSESEGA